MKVIVLASQKGGVGKTTTSANIGSSLASGGARVGMVDLELQGQLGVSLGAFARKPQDIGSALLDYIDAVDSDELASMTPLRSRMVDRTVLLKDFERPGTLSVIGSVMNVTDRARTEIAKRGWEAVSSLRHLLLTLQDDFDFIIVDTPPSADALASVALAAGDYVIAVCNPRLATADGARVVRNNVAKVPERTGGTCRPVFLGTVINEAQPPSKRTEEADAVDAFLNKHDLAPFTKEIRTSPQISASYGISRPIVIDEPSYAASGWFEDLTVEIIDRIRGLS
ncbi:MULTISPECIES: ParA family protein [unclassified Streptomyces]|uniref:Chromosome partitioning ATPase n=1 Tax=Streptomyces sp. F2 TaxID=317660 RepID=V9Z6F8_9ACTN|nr:MULTISPECIES: ParA family protein [unclassified Streptomyces]AHE39589.1 Chromosome partitioning ATPase [Streptomyces sp. F2]